MSLDIGAALEDGFSRTLERNGLIFAVVFLVLGVVSSVFAADLSAFVVETAVEETDLTVEDVTEGGGNPLLGDDPTEPLVGFSAASAAAGLIVAGLVQFVATIAATRTFASEETDAVPGEFFTRRILWVALNAIVGGIVFGIVLSIGFVLFVVPGIFLLVSLYFWWIVVVVEDENFVAGFQRSWEMASGNRWALLVLGVVVFLLSAVVNAVGTGLAEFASRWTTIVLMALTSAPVLVFSIATGARAYRQLRGGKSPTGEVESDTDPVAQ